MKALHLVKTATGAVWAMRQTRELVKLGVEVHVALPAGGALATEYERNGVCVHLLDSDWTFKRPWELRNRVEALRTLVKRIQPDIIHSHFVGTTLTARLAFGREGGVPRIFQVPGPLHLEFPLTRGGEVATAGSRDWWVGSCEWTVSRYRELGVPRERLFLSYYGTDVEAFNARRGTLRRTLGLSLTDPIVGMVAYFYAPKRYLGQSRGLKGHEDLLDAIALLGERFPELRCVFIGGAWGGAAKYEEEVRRYGAALCGERAVFLGTRKDVPDLIADCDVVVVPSHSENVGGAVEPLLSGVPVIATKVGGLPDVVRNGETGWTVPPRSPEAIAGAIVEVLTKRAQAAGFALAGQRLARRLFDVKRTAGEILSVYEEVLRSRGGAC